jgi:hypothetical protein
MHRPALSSIVRGGLKPALVLGAAAAITIVFSVASTGSASGGRTVRSQGDNQFVPNVKIQSTLKFTPGHIVITSGEPLTLEHGDQTQDPHALAIVDASDVPADIDAVFNCGSPGTVCDEVFQQFPGEPSGATFVNAAGTGDGIDGRLDTMFIVPGSSITEPVTAPAGTTLYFICAIHAWMQGTIDVK